MCPFVESNMKVCTHEFHSIMKMAAGYLRVFLSALLSFSCLLTFCFFFLIPCASLLYIRPPRACMKALRRHLFFQKTRITINKINGGVATTAWVTHTAPGNMRNAWRRSNSILFLPNCLIVWVLHSSSVSLGLSNPPSFPWEFGAFISPSRRHLCLSLKVVKLKYGWIFLFFFPFFFVQGWDDRNGLIAAGNYWRLSISFFLWNQFIDRSFK